MHEFESGAFGSNTPAWHGLGTVVPELMTTQEALELSGVGGVITRPEPVYLHLPDGTFKEVPEYVAQVREDNNDVLGIHTDRYVSEQYHSAFTDLGSAFEKDAKIWETMVLLRRGKIAAGVMRFPEFDRELIDGSHLLTYIAAYTSHDGTYALTYTDTNIRAECANKLRMIDSRQEGRRFAIRHINGKDEKKAEAIRVMSFAQERVDAMAKNAEELVAKKLSEGEIKSMLNILVPVSEEEGRSRTMAMNRQARIMNIYNDAPDQQDIKGTAWGFLQAVGNYVDHGATFRSSKTATQQESRFIKTVLDGNTLAEQAGALVAAL